MLYSIVRAILIPFLYLFYWPRVFGRENVPTQGALIVYSNHTSLLDPILLGCLLPRRVYFMAKQELFKLKWMSAFLHGLGAFPVKRGTADITAIKKSLQVLKEGKVFGIFPEGTRNKSGNIQDFSHGIASIAHKSKAAVIPVAIFNGYRFFRPVHVVIGKPLAFDAFYHQRSNTELLETMSVDLSTALQKMVDEHRAQ